MSQPELIGDVGTDRWAVLAMVDVNVHLSDALSLLYDVIIFWTVSYT